MANNHECTPSNNPFAAITDSNYFFNEIKSITGIVAMVTTMNGKFISINPDYLRLTGMKEDELIGYNVCATGLLEGDTDWASMVELLKAGKPVLNRTFKMKTSEGTAIDYFMSLKTMSLAGKKYILAAGVNSACLLKNDLSVHYQDLPGVMIRQRLKGSINAILSMLNLELRNMREEDALKSIYSIKSRVYSMSEAWNHLAKSREGTLVDLSSYIFKISETLFSTYSPAAGNIALKVFIPEIYADIKIAESVGLIINELLANSLQHAYPESNHGEISISMEKSGNNLSLNVSDDGKGLPAGFAPGRGTTMGFRLIKMLVSQIGGESSITNNNGTQITIKFNNEI